MAVCINAFLLGDTIYNKFSRVMNKIQCNNISVQLDEESVSKDKLLRITEWMQILLVNYIVGNDNMLLVKLRRNITI